MDIYGKKSQLEFSSWVYFTAWLWVGFSFRSRQTGGGGSEKTRDCKEEVAGSTAEPEPDSFYNQVLCLRGCTRGSETSQNPSGIASRPDAGQRSPAAAPRRSSTQKMCKPSQNPPSSLCDWEIWDSALPSPGTGHSWALQWSWEHQVPKVGELRWNVNVEF